MTSTEMAPGLNRRERVENEENLARVPVVLAIVVALLSIWLSYADQDRFVEIATEDGPYEWLTAVIYILAGLTFIWLAIVEERGRLGLLILGIGLFWVGGEELSWGYTWIFDAGPDAIVSRNRQREVNLHNIDGIDQIIRTVGVLVTGLVYVVWPVLVMKVKGARRLRARFALPVPLLIPSAVIIIVSSLLEIFSRMRGDLLRWPLGESGEVVLSLTALLFMIEVLRDRQRSPRLVLYQSV